MSRLINQPVEEILATLTFFHSMHFAGFIIGDALTDFSFQCRRVDENIVFCYRNKTVTAVRPGGDHDNISVGQIKILSLVGPELSTANNNHNKCVYATNIDTKRKCNHLK